MGFKRTFKYLIFALLIGIVGFLYSFTSKKNKLKNVSQLKVDFQNKSHKFLTASMVDKLLIQNDNKLINQAKSAIDLYRLENSIAQNPYVEKVAVFLTVDGLLKSKIKQREPIARVITRNSSYYIDGEGAKMPLSGFYSARVLLISGIENEEDILMVLPLLSYVLEDDFLQKEIVGIAKSYDDEFEFSVRSGAYKIDFGKLSIMETKFSMLKAFYNTTFKNKMIQDYKMITLKYHNQVVCTK